jgi:hypothetical protein
MSNALERGDLAARLDRGHAASCPSCQAFGHALESLHARLSRGAHTAAAPPPAPRRARWPLLVAGPLAVGAAAAIAITFGTGGGGPVPPPSIPAPVRLVQIRQVADRVSQAVARTPLEAELDDLLYDSRRGLDAVLATGSLDRLR